MAGERLIGDAYIAILPDVSYFRTRAAAEINSALAGQKFTVPITGDTRDVTAKIAAIAAALKGLNSKAKIDLNTKQAIADVAGLEAAIVGLWDRLENIPVDLDDSKGLAKLYGLMAGSDALAKQLEDIGDADFNINKALAKFYTLEAGAKALQDQIANLDANVNDAGANAHILEMGASVKVLADELDNLRADVTDTAALSKIITMQAAALKLAHQLNNMPVTADTLPFEASLFKLAAQVEAFKKSLGDVKITSQLTLPKTPGNYSTLNVGGLSPGEAQMMDELTVKTLDAMTAFQSLNKVETTNTGISALVAAGLAKMAAGQSMITASNAGGWWGALTTHVRLFGGALDSVLPKMLTSVSVWHIGADAILEFAAAWGPALIAVGTFAAYAYPVGEKIYGQWANINKILDGVGGKLPDLGSQFDTIERAIQPSILIAFGEYMMVIGKNAQGLGDALAKVGDVVDVWGAKLVGWASSAQKSFDNIVAVGAKDFAEIGYGFEQVFRIIGDLIKDLPGYVHILLLIGDAILTMGADAVAAAAPLLKVGLAIHGFMIYVGLAVTGIVALGRAMAGGAIASYAARTGTELAAAGDAAEASGGKFNRFGTAIGVFVGNIAGAATNAFRYGSALVALAGEEGVAAAASLALGDAFAKLPGVERAAGGGFTVLGAEMTGMEALAGGAAAAIGVGLIGALVFFAIKAYNAQSAAQMLNKQMEALIASSNAANINQNFTVALQKTTIAAQGNAAALQKLTGTSHETSQSLTELGPALANPEGGFSALGNKVIAATTNLKENSAATLQYVGQIQTYGQRMGALAQIFGSVGAAQTALSLTGISVGKVATENNAAWATQLTELQALAKGYGYMGQQAGAAGAQLDTLNIASGTVTKNLQSLTQAESAWVTMVTSGEAAFTTFEQGFPNLTGAMGKSAAGAATVSVTVGKLNERFTALGGTMTGTSASSLAVRQAFDSQLSAGTTLFGNLQTLATASGNTSTQQKELAKSGKDIIAQMLPFAAGSKQATAELSSLAQLMGGPATDNFQTLAKWVGNTKGAESDLNAQQAKLTISSASLTTASKNLGNALLSDVTNMEAAKTATATISGAVQGLYTAFSKGHGAVTTAAVSLSGEYVSALVKAGIGTTQATQYLNAYLKQLGYSPSAIAAIDSSLGQSVKAWQKNDAALQENAKATAAMVTATNNNKNALAGLNGLLPLTTTQFDKLWGSIIKQDAAMSTSGLTAKAAQSEFVNFANQGLGISITKAQELWQKFGQQNLDVLAAKAGATKQQFIQFAENGLHLTTTQAQTLWGEFALQNLDVLASKGINAKNKFIDLAKNGLDLSNSSAQSLWTTLTHQYLDTIASKAGETRDAFIKTAAQFGLTSAAAIILWDDLKKIPANVHTNVSETLTGSGAIKAAITAQSLTLSSSGAATQAANLVGVAAPKKARGGILSGPGPSGQDGPIFQGAPGELIIPASHAASHMAQAKREGVPGFAGGGILPGIPRFDTGGVIGTPAATVANVQQGISTAQNAIASFTKEAMQAFVNLLSPAWQAAGSAFTGSVPGGSANLLVIAKYLLANGLNRAAAAGIAATIDGESGGNPESRNCVPLSYRVVTNRGVLRYDQVHIGDTTPVFSPRDHTVHNAVIIDVPVHDGADTCRLGNAEWSVVSTWDHKWITADGGLLRVDQMKAGETKVMLGDGWYEAIDFIEDLGAQDTFCLTTTTGTWTTVTDEGDIVWTGNSGGWGLIGWTGNTVGLPPGYSGPTGNVQADMAAQLKGVIGYMNARGGRGPLNAAGNPVLAGDVWSRYEAPLVPLSDTRPGVANQLYAELGGGSGPAVAAAVQTQKQVAGKLNQVKPHSGGGVLNEPVYGFGANSGTPYSFAENGQPEFVSNASQAAAAGNPGMQGATNIGQQTLISQNNMVIRLLQQLPNVLGQAIGSSGRSGVQHGYYSPQG